MTDKFYEGTVYIGIVGGETENGECRDSIERIERRPGDSMFQIIRGTKGYETRQLHVNRFMQSDHAWLLMLDHDMIFPPHALERLRGHGKPYVSGFYMRRRYAPIAPIWFEAAEMLPYKPWGKETEPDKLYEIGASGWGCVLIHKDVILETRKILKGEPEIIEDDMDVWPYDLKAVIEGREQLRPLRAIKDVIMGSDIRFPFYARAAGFPLYGDSGVRCGHMLNYPLSADDFCNLPESYKTDLQATIDKNHVEEYAKINNALGALK